MRMDLVAGVILAGGKSRRMGSNKALLPFQGRRLIDHMVDLISSALMQQNLGTSAQQSLFCAPYTAISGEVESYPGIPDQYPDLGPLGGVMSVLESAAFQNFGRLLILPVDMPFLQKQTLLHLISSSEYQDPEEVQATHYDGFELPLLFQNSLELRHSLKELLNPEIPRSQCSIKELIRRLQGKAIPIPTEIQPGQFLNINTPHDWDCALQVDEHLTNFRVSLNIRN